MSDIINNLEGENWITIKDASDLLGISERHTWNIITANNLKTQKLLNQHRKKTYVLRADIENCKKSFSERIAQGELEISAKGKTLLSGRAKSLPELLKDIQAKQDILQKGITKWKLTAIWVSILGLTIITGALIYALDFQKRLSESQKELKDSRSAISEMYERNSGLADREREALKTLLEKESYIKRLERELPEKKLDKLKTKEQ